MKKALKLTIVAAFLLAAPVMTFAQPLPNQNGNGSGVGNIPVGGGGAPIDGGLSILLALGLGYGAKKVYNSKKKQLDE